MTRPRLEALRHLIDEATRAGVDPRVQRDAARELIDLIDSADTRRLTTAARAHDIADLRARGLTRATICERLRLTQHQYDHAMRTVRDMRTQARASSCASSLTQRNDPMPDLKSTSIKIGGGPPANLPNVNHKRPAAPAATTPRDGGGMSVGKTSGNYSNPQMLNVGNNSVGDANNEGADESLAKHG